MVYVGLIWIKKKNRHSISALCYVNVDVQLFWKLLLAVWKATDNSVFCKLTPHLHSSNQEDYYHIDSNRFIECHFE